MAYTRVRAVMMRKEQFGAEHPWLAMDLPGKPETVVWRAMGDDLRDPDSTIVRIAQLSVDGTVNKTLRSLIGGAVCLLEEDRVIWSGVTNVEHRLDPTALTQGEWEKVLARAILQKS